MTNLSDFITTLYTPTHGADESIKIAQELDSLPIEALAELAGVDLMTPLEKRAYGAVVGKSSSEDEDTWLGQFEDSPLYQAAIQLCEQELEMRAKHLQKRIERNRSEDHTTEWTERDQFNIQKKRLELALHKSKAAGKGTATTGAQPAAASAGTQPAAPAPRQGAPQTATSASGAGMMGQNQAKTAAKDGVKWHERARVPAGLLGGAAAGSAAGAALGLRLAKKVHHSDAAGMIPRGTTAVGGLTGMTAGIAGAIRTLKPESKRKMIEPALHEGRRGIVLELKKNPNSQALRRDLKSFDDALAKMKRSSAFNPLLSGLYEKIARLGMVSRGLRGMETRATLRAATSRAGKGGAKSVAKPPPVPAMSASGKPVLRRLKPGQMSAGGQKMRAMTEKAFAGAERQAAR